MPYICARAARLAALAFASLLLAACAPMHHKALAAQDRERIQQVDLQIVVPQETFVFSASSPGVSLALGGGLIPALIDASVQKSRQEAMRGEIQSTIDKVIELDFREEARLASAGVQEGFPVRLASVSISPAILSQPELDKRIAATKGSNAFLRLLVHYALEPATMTLTARTHALLWQEGRSDPSYAGSLIYQGQAQGATVDDPDSLREHMRLAMADTLKLLAIDLQAVPSNGRKPAGSHPMLVNGIRVNLPADRIGGLGDQIVLRHADGALLSLRSAGVAP